MIILPSLEIVPAKYNGNILLSQIPIDGSGDFTVTRATSATRVNASGLIESAKTNLAFNSETWASGSNWLIQNVTRASGSTAAFTAPDGNLTANALSPTSGNTSHRCFSNDSTRVTFTSGTIYTMSAFFKAGTGTAGQMAQITFGTTCFTQSSYANFDLQLGINTVVSGSATDTNRAASIQNYGNGWYRCTLRATCNVSSTDFGVITPLITASGDARSPSFAGTVTDVLYGWGAQVEEGSSASEYIPTTTVARTRFAGVTVDGTVASGIPRLDYFASGGVVGCPALLVEPASTNFAPNANLMNVLDTPTASGGVTFTTGSTDFLAPDGTSGSINKYVGGAASGSTQNTRYAGTAISVTAAGQHTFSLFVKAGATNPLNFCALSFGAYSGGSGTATSYFSLASGTAFTAGASIQDYGNGWYRLISAPYTIASGDLQGTVSFNLAASSGSSSFAASGALNLTAYTWGAQVETGSVATSYIPTTTAAVTRNADLISVSGAVSGSIGQTEGTIYVEVDLRNIALTNARIPLYIMNAANPTQNSIRIEISSVGAWFTSLRANNSTIYTLSTSNSRPAGIYKIAAAYKDSDSAFYVNGVQIATSNAAFTFTSALNKIAFEGTSAGNNTFNDRIRAAALYTTRLSNTQLALLTSPYTSYSQMASALSYTLG